MEKGASTVHLFDVGEQDVPDDPPQDAHLERGVGDAVGDCPGGRQEHQDDRDDQQRLDDEQDGHA